jgi:hypothetical protein
MAPEENNGLLKLVATVTILNANITANLLNDGDPITAITAEPGSLARANELLGLAADLKRELESVSTENLGI